MQNAILQIGKKGQKQSWLAEVHQGAEGPCWTAVPSKKKKKKKKKKKEEEEEKFIKFLIM